MLILAINTASSRTGIALFKVKVPKSSAENLQIPILAEDSWPAKNNEAEKLMPAIANLLKTARQNLTDIKQIYVIKGPGSFTGLRVGITVANTIAYLNNCELFGLSTFEYWHSASQATGSDNLTVLIYAGSGGVYLSEYARSTSEISEPEIINLSELNQKFESKKIKSITGDISPAQIAILKNIKFIKIKKTFAEIMKPIIEKKIQKSIMRQSRVTPVKIIRPLYIKEPGITIPKARITFS